MAERDLVLGIIQQAVIDSKIDLSKIEVWHGRRDKARLLKDDAKTWLTSKSTEICSLSWYCDLINLDRGWLKRMKYGINPDVKRHHRKWGKERP